MGCGALGWDGKVVGCSPLLTAHHCPGLAAGLQAGHLRCQRRGWDWERWDGTGWQGGGMGWCVRGWDLGVVGWDMGGGMQPPWTHQCPGLPAGLRTGKLGTGPLDRGRL